MLGCTEVNSMFDDPPSSTNLLSTFFDASPAPQLITSQRLMYGFNEALLSLFCYTHDELLGELILKLYPSQSDYQAIGVRCLSHLRINSPTPTGDSCSHVMVKFFGLGRRDTLSLLRTHSSSWYGVSIGSVYSSILL